MPRYPPRFVTVCMYVPLISSHLSRLGLPDRASALGLVRAFLDFDGSEEAWRRYDKITAREVRNIVA